MAEEPDSLKASDDTLSNDSPDSPSVIRFNEESYLNFDENSELSFDDKAAIFSSLVALVKAEYPFDDALQDRAARFLQNLGPKWNKQDAAQLVTELVPSSDGSCAGFVASIVTLLSSPHSTVVTAAVSFVRETTTRASAEIRCRLVDFDLITKVLATVQPHTLPITGKETIFENLNWIIFYCLEPASASSVGDLSTTEAVEQFDHLEMILQKVVLPSSQYVTFLITNRHVLNRDLSSGLTLLLVRFIRICPFHRPTSEFVLASPIAMALSYFLSSFEFNILIWTVVININDSLREWKREGREMIQFGKRMMQALFSEGFDNTLEQMLMNNRGGDYGRGIVTFCRTLSILSLINLVPETEPHTAVRNRRLHATPDHSVDPHEVEQLVEQTVPAVRKRAHIPKRKGGSTDLANPALMSILENSQVE
ncbi:hypothetical protein BLNAU_14895 [Blattamonas nauphoetae]|uniref:Uncharacterized protein n=1 Tax=Blattamonas nauphoetae TaxID=2049346 RepID=A0ABQ9XEU1_9EUKA|nr:hypothetical protein BLNAU_14895 [Blattamonas nauphoetae]